MNSSWRRWLAGMVFLYPFYWISASLLRSFLPLLQIGFLNYRLTYFRANFMALSLAAAPAGSVGDIGTGGFASDSFWITVALMFLAVALTSRLARSHRLLGGLAAASFGVAGTLTSAFRLRTGSAEFALEFLLFFGILVIGLRWMLAAIAAGGYLRRVLTLFVYFNLPLALPWLVIAVLFYFRGTWMLWLLMPGIVASLLAALLPVSRTLAEPMSVGLKTVAAGVAISLALAACIAWGSPRLTRRFKQAELAAGRAAVESLPRIPQDQPYEKIFFQKGVNYTAEMPAVYTSEAARERLKLLPQFGVNAIALVPYGGASRRSPRVRLNSGDDSWESDAGLEQLARVAHAQGMRVLLKPQLYAGGEVTELAFSSPQDRDQWFADYQIFLEHYAQLATRVHADLFCVGVELSKLSSYDAEWRRMIARVRELYRGPLVYAANFGDEFETLTFWDALDYIGLDNYYPLADDYSAAQSLNKVEAVQKRFNRPVIFTEAGFPSLEGAHRRPWDEDSRIISLDEQRRCYDAVFRAFYDKPWFQGIYWWKVETVSRPGPQDGTHTPWDKPAMQVIRRWYTAGGR